MTNEAPKSLFDMSEDSLKHFHLGIGETAAEQETADAYTAFLRQANMVNAIGNWRFPETWGNGLPLDEQEAA